MDTEHKKAGAGIQLVTFQLGAEYYGTPVWMVREIIRPVEIFQVPGIRGSVQGVINLRGLIIPVLKIREVLGISGSDEVNSDRKQRIVILDSDSGEFGFLVDDVFEVVRISSDEVKPPPVMSTGEDGRGAIIGIIQQPGKLIICVDPRKLVDSCVNVKEVLEGITQ